MRYVDSFVLPIPTKNLKKYLGMARLGKRLWMKHGALAYMECVGDDLKNAWGVTFPKQLKLKPRESVIVAYIVFKSRAHRDRVNAKVMKELMASSVEMEMPFDPRRGLYGGFKVIVGS
jgi:uncharacterized protein YbaA (DUF1428 family)